MRLNKYRWWSSSSSTTVVRAYHFGCVPLSFDSLLFVFTTFVACGIESTICGRRYRITRSERCNSGFRAPVPNSSFRFLRVCCVCVHITTHTPSGNFVLVNRRRTAGAYLTDSYAKCMRVFILLWFIVFGVISTEVE